MHDQVVRSEIQNLYVKSKWDRFYFKIKWRKGSAVEEVEKVIPKKGKIIDIGCGTGILANYLVLKSGDRSVIGVDLDERRINIAKKTIGPKKNLNFYQKNVLDLELIDCSCMIMYDLLHHITFDMQEDLIKKCYDKLPKGAMLIIKDVDTKPFWKYVLVHGIDWITAKLRITDGSKLSFRSSKNYITLLQNIGFTVSFSKLNLNDFVPHVLFICRK